MCDWRIESSAGVLVGSGDERTIIERALKAIEWGRLREIKVSCPSLDLATPFDPDLSLYTFSASGFEEDQWTLFTPDGMAFTAHAGGRCHYHPSSQVAASSQGGPQSG